MNIKQEFKQEVQQPVKNSKWKLLLPSKKKKNTRKPSWSLSQHFLSEGGEEEQNDKTVKCEICQDDVKEKSFVVHLNSQHELGHTQYKAIHRSGRMSEFRRDSGYTDIKGQCKNCGRIFHPIKALRKHIRGKGPEKCRMTIKMKGGQNGMDFEQMKLLRLNGFFKNSMEDEIEEDKQDIILLEEYVETFRKHVQEFIYEAEMATASETLREKSGLCEQSGPEPKKLKLEVQTQDQDSFAGFGTQVDNGNILLEDLYNDEETEDLTDTRNEQMSPNLFDESSLQVFHEKVPPVQPSISFAFDYAVEERNGQTFTSL